MARRGSRRVNVPAGSRVRIIGGRHRGRRLAFPDLPGLRPTPDRVRETLFNWLQPQLSGAACLDLFAGSGALGLEAASRGAGRVVMLDRSPLAVAALRRNVEQLGLDGQVTVIRADALAWLEGPAEPFDILFLDPPFAEGLLEPGCRALEEGGWLAPGARIYLERALKGPAPGLPGDWAVLREKRAGQVCYQLLARGI
ncbi:MAG TPA: 16S rRNA (guanine(966)-N(2))-methyltransferase RsmD [Sedimenticola sp.]|nr:16S rRNA (guanine(966)-N(2))-methyltransferase RsmD [Sedimenticola sp.]